MAKAFLEMGRGAARRAGAAGALFVGAALLPARGAGGDPRAAAGARPGGRAGTRGGGARRRLLLGRAGRVPARRGREERRLGLCRRRGGHGAVPARSAAAAPATPRRSRSPTIRPRSATASCCRSSSRSRTTRPSSTGRGPTSARSTARRSSPQDAEQAKVAEAYIAQLDQAGVFRAPIVTTIEPDRAFYPAEDYHQDFLTLNPTIRTSSINDLPKLENLKRLFPAFYRDEPVLVARRARFVADLRRGPPVTTRLTIGLTSQVLT